MTLATGGRYRRPCGEECASWGCECARSSRELAIERWRNALRQFFALRAGPVSGPPKDGRPRDGLGDESLAREPAVSRPPADGRPWQDYAVLRCFEPNQTCATRPLDAYQEAAAQEEVWPQNFHASNRNHNRFYELHHLTFDMSGGPKGAKRPLERPLDGGVRRLRHLKSQATTVDHPRQCRSSRHRRA